MSDSGTGSTLDSSPSGTIASAFHEPLGGSAHGVTPEAAADFGLVKVSQGGVSKKVPALDPRATSTSVVNSASRSGGSTSSGGLAAFFQPLEEEDFPPDQPSGLLDLGSGDQLCFRRLSSYISRLSRMKLATSSSSSSCLVGDRRPSEFVSSPSEIPTFTHGGSSSSGEESRAASVRQGGGLCPLCLSVGGGKALLLNPVTDLELTSILG